ncbi:MAG: Mur ligase [Olpidium bornovanus]|uniref:Dihydrofolate synthetase n=1 Tax=Olpidium bornovanus TaxID=278681 RepID=A0A8H7ZRA0_9FUNG|nr:MAG: Mur ligase [Olpidium bornovanus]
MDLQVHRVRAALARLGDPHDSVPAVHVAGTNGKGSVCAFVAACLRAAGLRVGRYVSPHLFEQRDSVLLEDNLPPSPDSWLAALQRARAASQELTEFERATVAAFVLFAERTLDVAVVEVGLGGLGDATNVFSRPLVTAVTSIGLDHTALLGSTVREIARQKAGIFKAGSPVVIGPQPERDALDELVGQARSVAGTEPFLVQPAKAVSEEGNGDSGPAFSRMLETEILQDGQCPRQFRFRIGLRGDVQLENAATAVAVLQVLRCCHQGRFRSLTDAHILQGMSRARWPGRLDLIPSPVSPISDPILVDGAHNPPAAAALGCYLDATVRTQTSPNVRWILGISQGKDVSEILANLGVRSGDIVAAVSFSTPETMPWVKCVPPETVVDYVLRTNARGVACQSVASAMECVENARTELTSGPAVLCGSLYLAADFYRILVEKGSYGISA